MSSTARPDPKPPRSLRPRRTLATRLARRDEPWFVTPEAARNTPLMRLLAMALLPDEERALAGVERAEAALQSWRAEHGDRALDDGELRDLLQQCVADALAPVAGTPLTSGISSGFDSRPLIQTMWDLGHEPTLYCCGQPGNIDWDVVQWLRERMGLDVHMLDTTTMPFSIEEYELKRATSLDLPLGAVGLANDLIDELVPRRINVHGFLNDTLTGDNREKAKSAVGDDRAAFIGRNDQFLLQQLMEPSFIDRLAPSAAVSPDRELDLYRQFDIAYRQYSRIRPFDNEHQTHVFPFEDERWMGYWLGRPLEERAAQTRWMAFVRGMGSELLADLDGIEEEGKRLRWARKWRFYGHKDTPGLIDLDALDVTPQHEPAFPFDPYACARNNPTFRAVLETSLARVRGRRVFRESFLSAVETRFWAGDVTASKMLNGVVTADIALASGRIDE